MRNWWLAGAWAGCVAAVAGVLVTCGPLAGRGEADSEAPAHRCEMWVDALAGEPVRYAEVLADLAGARVVYLGERHGTARHHRWQQRIVAGLASQRRLLVLALEQIEAHYQPAVDRYNRGEIDFEGLAQATDWAHRWSNYADYRPAVEAAHEAGVPILALNARQETIRQVARGGGIANLPPSLRAELPASLETEDPVYERVLRPQLAVHGMASAERLRAMVEAQIARDETMAERLAGFLRSAGDAPGTAVVLAGAGHVAYGLGMPSRVCRRLPGMSDRIVLFSATGEAGPPQGAQAGRQHEELRAIGCPIADYLSLAQAAPDR